MDIRAQMLVLFQDFECPDRSSGRDMRANDPRMSADIRPENCLLGWFFVLEKPYHFCWVTLCYCFLSCWRFGFLFQVATIQSSYLHIYAVVTDATVDKIVENTIMMDKWSQNKVAGKPNLHEQAQRAVLEVWCPVHEPSCKRKGRDWSEFGQQLLLKTDQNQIERKLREGINCHIVETFMGFIDKPLQGYEAKNQPDFFQTKIPSWTSAWDAPATMPCFQRWLEGLTTAFLTRCPQGYPAQNFLFWVEFLFLSTGPPTFQYLQLQILAMGFGLNMHYLSALVWKLQKLNSGLRFSTQSDAEDSLSRGEMTLQSH